MRAFSIFLSVVIVVIFPCFQGNAKTDTISIPKSDVKMIDMQRQIDDQWDRLQLTRKICEVNCSEGKCRCLDELRTKEIPVIEMMVIYASFWNVLKADRRPFALQYYWNPEDALSQSDFKELLVAFPDSSCVKSLQLGLHLLSEGDPVLDLAKILQELYAQKKVSDIQAYLKKIGLLTIRMPGLNFGTRPCFTLVSTSWDEQKMLITKFYFSAEIYDQEKFSDLESKKFPWTPTSISLMVALAKTIDTE